MRFMMISTLKAFRCKIEMPTLWLFMNEMNHRTSFSNDKNSTTTRISFHANFSAVYIFHRVLEFKLFLRGKSCLATMKST